MANSAVHHLGLATYDYEACLDFYTRVLEFDVVYQEQWETPDGVPILKHLFLDTGNGSVISFMCPTPENPEYPDRWDCNLNSGLGVRHGTYHFSFAVDSLDELERRQKTLRERGCEATEIFDHGFCKSVYFLSPDGLNLEFTLTTRVFNDDDKILKRRTQPGNTNYIGRPELARHDFELIGYTGAALDKAVAAAAGTGTYAFAGKE